MILAWLAAAFLAGVTLGADKPLPVAVLLGIGACCSVAALAARRRKLCLPLLALAGFALGLARAPHSTGSPGPGELAFYVGRSVQLQGVIATEPDIRDTGSNYVVDIRQVTLGGKNRMVAGRLYIHTSRSVQLDYGHAVTVTGRVRPPFSGLKVQGISGEMRFPRLLDQGLSASGPLLLIMRLRQSIEDGINRWLPEPEAALLIAITLGAKSASLGDLAPALVRTGLIHIVAISGIKVAMVAGTLFALVRRSGFRFPSFLFAVLAIAAYVLLTGATASGIRSASMWALAFLAWYLGRGTVSWFSLLIVAAGMVALEPTLPWDIGFQLSAIGTFTIIAWSEPFGSAFRLIPSPLRESFSTTVAAQIGTLPIVILGFHVVSVAGPLANTLVLPFLPFLIAIGFGLGAVSGLGQVAAPIAGLAWALLHLVASLARVLSVGPAALTVASIPTPLVGTYYLALAALALLALRRVRWSPTAPFAHRGRELGVGALAALALLTWSAAASAHSSSARLYALGTGRALVIRSDGMSALIDGSPKPFTLLERLGEVLPYSNRTIDLVVVTDPRSSNLVGLEAVLQHYQVGEVLDVGAEYPSVAYARWREELRVRHVPLFALRTWAGSRLGPVSLRVLGPNALYPRPQDSAGIIRIELPGKRVLLAGPASRREQREIVFRPVDLKANTLIIDGKDGFDPDFLRAVGPNEIITQRSLPPGWRLTQRLPQGINELP